MSFERHHSRHVAPPQIRYERVDWRPQRPRSDRVRVQEYTCDCGSVFYELCQSGGLLFVRRTETRANGATVVHESPWEIAKQARELWFRLLMGAAR
ncbi:hypothetical protein FHS43_003535 [Streptosporangium becharense]|uniref:Uncharacterized protein n=1 Tax=Streptosporangium becharense TaxID=1816182 RepID=A0A7W9MF92_9ACTN|nr:hypothetical protein [Streptosporangium becharense]MBB2912255.1 hypothetical protein [Streptosporangium becharense]MBB5818802.1 hypothetical protein [Streptosporangium becharense]